MGSLYDVFAGCEFGIGAELRGASGGSDGEDIVCWDEGRWHHRGPER
jgi:hypothetical protein